MIDESILRSDLARVISDWGVIVQYRTVTSNYHPATQTVEETYVDQDVSVLIENEPRKLASDTGGTYFKRELMFRMLTDELPTDGVQIGQRVVWGEREYEIVESTRSADGLTVRIVARER